MRLSEAKKIVMELTGEVIDVRVVRIGNTNCLEILWKDNTTSLIPTKFFIGHKDEKKALKHEVMEIIRFRREK